MKKEIIISVVVGLISGLIIVYGVYTARTSLSKPTADQTLLETNPLASVSPSPNNGQLAIHSPADEIIVDQRQLTITGTTIPHTYVVVFVNNDENILTSDSAGSFSMEAVLETGSNIIIIYAIDSDGNTIVEERTVIYTTEPLIDTETTNAETETNDPEAEADPDQETSNTDVTEE